MKLINDDDWAEYYIPVLLMLTKRYAKNDSNPNLWADIISTDTYKCKICNNHVNTDNYLINRSLTEHGLFHLKEHNLLPFI